MAGDGDLAPSFQTMEQGPFGRHGRTGGGIFQPTLQYGGGATPHLSPHTFVRFDLRETLSRQPDFWSKSYATIETVDENGVRTEAGELVLHSPLRHRLFTIGMGVSF